MGLKGAFMSTSTPILEVRHLKKGFDGEDVIRDLSFSLMQGEVKVIIGPSGCGKSTLLRCINGLEKVDGGQILLEGEAIQNRTKDLHLIRQKIGMVFQSYDLFPHMTVMQNLLLAPIKALQRAQPDVEREARVWLERIGLSDKAQSLPRQLSGGQKQRVSIARALIKDSPILIMDDSLSAVDTDTEDVILSNLKELRQNKTTIMIAHRVSTVRNADHILFLEDGKMAEYGTYDELMALDGQFAQMAKKQQLESALASEA